MLHLSQSLSLLLIFSTLLGVPSALASEPSPDSFDPLFKDVKTSLAATLTSGSTLQDKGAQIGFDANYSGHTISVSVDKAPQIGPEPSGARIYTFNFDMTIHGVPGMLQPHGRQNIQLMVEKKSDGNYQVVGSSSLDSNRLPGMADAMKQLEDGLAEHFQEQIQQQVVAARTPPPAPVVAVVAVAHPTKAVEATLAPSVVHAVVLPPIVQVAAHKPVTKTAPARVMIVAKTVAPKPKVKAVTPKVVASTLGESQVIASADGVNPFNEKFRNASWTDPETGLTINGRYEIKDGQSVKDVKIINLFLQSHLAEISAPSGLQYVSLTKLKSEVSHVIADPSTTAVPVSSGI